MATISRADQGTLNRVRASFTFEDFPGLNITAPFLHKDAPITLTRNGDIVTTIETLLGRVSDPQPYQTVMVSVTLNRAMSLANDFETQLQDKSVLGNGTLKSDATAFQAMKLINITIKSLGDIRLASGDVAYKIDFEATYEINNFLLSL
jgi:hypothetical protein